MQLYNLDCPVLNVETGFSAQVLLGNVTKLPRDSTWMSCLFAGLLRGFDGVGYAVNLHCLPVCHDVQRIVIRDA